MTSQGPGAACGQVDPDEGDSGAGGFRGSAAIADTVTAHVVHGALHDDDVSGAIQGDSGRGGESHRFTEDAPDLGERVGEHGLFSSILVRFHVGHGPAAARAEELFDVGVGALGRVFPAVVVPPGRHGFAVKVDRGL